MKATATIRRLTRTTTVALFLAFSFISGAQAQVTIDQSYIESFVGQVFDVDQYLAAENDAALDPLIAASGENQTWDFSTLSYADTMGGSYHFMTMPAETPLADDAAYASADYVIEGTFSESVGETESDSTFWTYHSANADSASSHGGVFIYQTDVDGDGESPDTLAFAFDPPRKNLVFPLTYGTTWQQTTTSSFGSTTTTDYEVDGYGTVIAPGGETNQCLRIRSQDEGGLTVSYEFICEGGAFSATLSETSAGGVSFTDGSVTLWSVSSAVARDEVDAPERYRLTLDGPNPFTERTSATLHLDRSETVQVALYDLTGRLVQQVASGRLPAGVHPVEIAGTGLASGTYVLRAEAGGIVRSELIVRVR